MKSMKSILILLTLLLPIALSAQFSINGTRNIKVKSQINEISQIFVCENLDQKSVTLSYSYPSSENNTYSCWYYQKGDTQPKAYTDFEISSGKIIFKTLQDQTAYGVMRNNDPITYIWIFDYKQHQSEIESITPINTDNDNCSMLRLYIHANENSLIYYALSGYNQEVQREFQIDYNTLKWSEDHKYFTTYTKSITKGVSIPETYIEEPPLCNTQFTLYGDQFQTSFGHNKKVLSDYYQAEKVTSVAIATIVNPSKSNIKTNNDITLNEYISYPINNTDSPIDIEGSAPLNIDFYAYGNTPVSVTNTWEIASDNEYMDLESQYTNPYSESSSKFNYPFRKAGTYYVRLINSSSGNQCESVTNSFRIKIYDSRLDIPNAFSPGSDGINDIFKVSYQSLLRFKGWIFNRWGNQLFHWSDPAQGWDGTYNGKPVPSGVYFYIIEAEGSDGKIYKKKGDINLFKEQ